VHTVRFIGPGRAGSSLSLALHDAGWHVAEPLRRGDDLSAAAEGVDAVIVACPDDAVASVSSAIRPVPSTVVVHLSGSLGLSVLAPHRRRAALHPLVPLPTTEEGARRLASGITFAVAGDPLARSMASDLGGTIIEVADEDRAAYHAAACIAANHVVALLGQVERVAADAGLPFDAFVGLTRAAVDDVARIGPRRALTGPAARGDWSTLARHRDALAAEERTGYNAGVALAMRLAGDAARDRTANLAPAPSTPVPAIEPAAEPAELRG
jgi:predicted short-subunit dehydrogenase-like oxidoreductase (DUF2520 family)